MFQCNENQAKLFYEAQYITIFECQNTTRTNKEKLGFHVNGNKTLWQLMFPILLILTN